MKKEPSLSRPSGNDCCDLCCANLSGHGLNLAYGSIQFRFSEALTILPIFTPAAVPGLAIGCLIGNLASPYPLDLVFGTAASLIAALLTRRCARCGLKTCPCSRPCRPYW